jgi:16S rRNA (guanine527-N7)-methyltransferase
MSTQNIFAKYGYNLDENQLIQFDKYYHYLVECNEKFNLTAITEQGEVYTKHFVDSLLGQAFITPNAKVVDVGAGAGFPSVPLKIVRSDIDVTMVDSLSKRVNFLKEVGALLNIDVNACHDRAEDFAKRARESYDVAVARAVAPLNVLLEYLAPLVKVGGKVLAYKTDESEVETSANAIKTLGLKLKFAHHFVLEGANRCVLEFEKVKNTPPQYPRGQNKPRKNPL